MFKRFRLISLLVLLVLNFEPKAFCADPGKAKQKLQIGHATQLFVDDAIIQHRQGVVRRVQAATKMDGPVLTPERPWEFSYHPEDDGIGKRIYVYGTVFYDPLQKQYRMWYMSRMSNRHNYKIPELGIPGKNVHSDLTLYATSRDGINWERPNLGLYKFDGNTRNNIMLDFHGASVFLDQDEPDPQKRGASTKFECATHLTVLNGQNLRMPLIDITKVLSTPVSFQASGAMLPAVSNAPKTPAIRL